MEGGKEYSNTTSMTAVVKAGTEGDKGIVVAERWRCALGDLYVDMLTPELVEDLGQQSNS